MDIVTKIESFASDIYFKYPNEINNDFIGICSDISNFFDDNYPNNQEVAEQRDQLLGFLLIAMETRDYIKMADALYYTVKPIFEDINGVEA